jgi:hypothetical protein
VERFKAFFSLKAIIEQLPFHFPSTVEPSEPIRFRALSWYTYPGWYVLADPEQLASMTGFYVALHLIDFSTLRAELVALMDISLNAPGQTPYDPVSLFLCCLLRWHEGLGWKKLAKRLAGPHGGAWRRLFGFHDRTPSASTMRTFYNDLGSAFHTDLCPRFITLLNAVGLLPKHNTHHATPAHRGLPVGVDGMLHDAHSRMRCSKVTDTCYQPTSPEDPRPCPAREAGKRGCDCTDPACAHACRRTTPRDAESRFIHYTGRNRDGEKDPRRARNVYGYRSYPMIIADDELHSSWIAYTTVHPANTDERAIFPDAFAHLLSRLSQITFGELVSDSAISYAPCLNPIYNAGVIPTVDIRHDPTDEDEDTCIERGYDEHGHPLCTHGYPMAFNGVDYARLRACWVCRQVCADPPDPKPEDTTCPFRDPDRPLGQARHVKSAFIHPDGSHHERLARLYPFGSDLWKEHYTSRRNITESRNGQITRLGLDRIWSYGLDGATADICFADFLINLRNLGQLVQQATLLGADASPHNSAGLLTLCKESHCSGVEPPLSLRMSEAASTPYLTLPSLPSTVHCTRQQPPPSHFPQLLAIAAPFYLESPRARNPKIALESRSTHRSLAEIPYQGAR